MSYRKHNPYSKNDPVESQGRINGYDVSSLEAVPRTSTLNIREVDYIVPDRDPSNNSIKVNLRLSPVLERLLETIIQSGRYPIYQTVQDLMRHAIVRHIADLQALSPEAVNGTLMSLCEAQNDLATETTMARELWTTLERLAKLADGLWRQGDVWDAHVLVQRIKHRLNKFPSSDAKRKFSKGLERHFKGLSVSLQNNKVKTNSASGLWDFEHPSESNDMDLGFMRSNQPGSSSANFHEANRVAFWEN
jgi:hypothetical protein